MAATMTLNTKHNGQSDQVEVTLRDGLTAIVHKSSIKVTPVDHDALISPETTVATMREMSEKAWAHISTGELFQHMFNILFKHDPVTLPDTIAALHEDYSIDVIHACGLVVQLVEARFEGKKKVFLQLPETYLHPGSVAMIGTLLMEMQKIRLPPTEYEEGVL